jgi:hypothetical protein
MDAFDEFRQALLSQLDQLEKHVASCGNLRKVHPGALRPQELQSGDEQTPTDCTGDEMSPSFDSQICMAVARDLKLCSIDEDEPTTAATSETKKSEMAPKVCLEDREVSNYQDHPEVMRQISSDSFPKRQISSSSFPTRQISSSSFPKKQMSTDSFPRAQPSRDLHDLLRQVAPYIPEGIENSAGLEGQAPKKRLSMHSDDSFLIRRGRGYFADNVFHILDHPGSSRVARWYGELMNVLILCSVFIPIVESTQRSFISGPAAPIIEISIGAYFIAEQLVRFVVAPDRCHLWKVIHTYIDILASLPFILRLIVFDMDADNADGHNVMVLVSVVPILRFLKLLRRFEKFTLLQKAFSDAAEALPVLLYTLTTIALTFSCLIYLVEPRNNIETFPEAMWLVVVTMSTVGYGDRVPESSWGHIIITVLILGSALYMAIPLGIIGATFNNIWKERDCILLVKRCRDQMDERGYTAKEIPQLFDLFCSSDDSSEAELSRGDFVRMIESMHISLPTERVISLFDTFDINGTGSIDALEFIRHVFPRDFHELYHTAIRSGT